MSELDKLWEIHETREVTPLQAAVLYLSGKHKADAEKAAVELEKMNLKIIKLETMLDVCRREKDALKYKLSARFE